jgi:hypothetical protein
MNKDSNMNGCKGQRRAIPMSHHPTAANHRAGALPFPFPV